MDFKNNEFIHFPKDYSKKLDDLIDYCTIKHDDAGASCTKNNEKLSSYYNKLKMGNIKSKENQTYMKLYEKNIGKLAKTKDETKREAIKSEIKRCVISIRENTTTMRALKTEIEKLGSPQKIKKSVETFDAFEDLLEDLLFDLEQYSTYITSLTVAVEAFEKNGMGNEKNIVKIQNKTVGLEEKIKDQLSKLIATGIKFQDKLPERLKNYKPKNYTIEQMIKDRKTKLKDPALDRELTKLNDAIRSADSLEKLNI